MAQNNSKQPAFPHTWSIEGPDGSVETTIIHGLTKREYFAGLALQGLFASVEGNNFPLTVACAKKAVEAADALLLELSKPQP